MRKLALQADVLLENFKLGGLKQYGLDAASLLALNPRLVYCSITGFGQDGPYAARAGYDFLIQGMGGLMSITGVPDGEPGGGPQKVGVAQTDIMTGLYATIAVQAALAERTRSGLGQHIDLALLDVQVAALGNQAANYLCGGKVPQRMGNAHPNIVPYQDFPTADGDMILAIGNDGQFARFCTIAGHPEWAQDERFATNPQRVAHRAILIPLLRQATVMRTTDEWITAFELAAVPCGPVNRIDQVFADPQVVARGLKVEMAHPTAGTVALVANPVRLSARRCSTACRRPCWGSIRTRCWGSGWDWVRPTSLACANARWCKHQSAGPIGSRRFRLTLSYLSVSFNAGFSP